MIFGLQQEEQAAIEQQAPNPHLPHIAEQQLTFGPSNFGALNLGADNLGALSLGGEMLGALTFGLQQEEHLAIEQQDVQAAMEQQAPNPHLPHIDEQQLTFGPSNFGALSFGAFIFGALSFGGEILGAFGAFGLQQAIPAQQPGFLAVDGPSILGIFFSG